jgi:outer membrane protein OmpA-like peptidoglycan-associated protein
MGAIALASALLAVTPEAYAQENSNRDEYGKVVRGPYQTNRFCDNWFVGAGGGINTLLGKGYEMAIAPSIDANVGKWFTPSVGMRMGYQGFKSKVWADDPSLLGDVRDVGKDKYGRSVGYMYFHGDFLMNMSNAISGYKETRFWNMIPYAHAGYLRAYGLDGVDFSEDQIAAGIGTLHNLRLTDRLDLIIDMRTTAVSGRIMDGGGTSFLCSVTAGMAVDLGYPSFVRTASVMADTEMAWAQRVETLELAAVALEAANSSLLHSNKQLSARNKYLTSEIDDLIERLAEEGDVYGFYDGMSPAVYFEIGKAELSPFELKHLEFIADDILSKADDHSQILITVMGLADSNTGSARRNCHLSHARGKYVFDILVNKYGIDKERIVLESQVVESENDPVFDRAVVISF